MAKVKCRICGERIDKTIAYAIVTQNKQGEEKRTYFCSEEEYQNEEQRKIKAAADKDKAYYLICEIIGRKEIINTILWKEWALWNKVASNEKIGQYLEENKVYLIDVIGRLANVELGRIKYLSAILKNNLSDFKPKIKETPKPKIQVDETFYAPTSNNNNNKRRSLADLEDEF